MSAVFMSVYVVVHGFFLSSVVDNTHKSVKAVSLLVILASGYSLQQPEKVLLDLYKVCWFAKAFDQKKNLFWSFGPDDLIQLQRYTFNLSAN